MDTKKLRQKILDLAIHGKLVPQDPNDEPASVLLERIRAEKERLIAEGKIKRSKKSATSDTPHYENVPFEIPEGWCWTTIGEVMTLRSGTNIKVRECKSLGEYPIYGGNGINGTYNEFNVEANTLVIGRVGFYCGSVNITESKAWVTDNALIVSYIDVFEPRFLLYLLQYLDLGKTSNSTAQPVVSGKGILPLLIPIPPLNEQCRILSELDKLLNITATIDENKVTLNESISRAKLKILDLAIHGKLVPQDANDEPASELLKRINPKAPASCDNPHYQVPYQVPNNWIWCHLKNICAKIVDGDHNPPAGAKGKTSYMMLSSKNINNDSLVDIDNCRFITFEDWVICNSRTKLTKGDILLTTVATLGRSCVYDSEIPFCFQRSVTVITTMINNYYLKFLFDSPYYQSLMNDSAKGTAQKGFYLNQLEQSLIPVPPMPEQLRIVSKINELFSQLDMIEKSLQA